jgi:hypothetical protein
MNANEIEATFTYNELCEIYCILQLDARAAEVRGSTLDYQRLSALSGKVASYLTPVSDEAKAVAAVVERLSQVQAKTLAACVRNAYDESGGDFGLLPCAAKFYDGCADEFNNTYDAIVAMRDFIDGDEEITVNAGDPGAATYIQFDFTESFGELVVDERESLLAALDNRASYVEISLPG